MKKKFFLILINIILLVSISKYWKKCSNPNTTNHSNMKLEAGSLAPTFIGKDQNGKNVKLNDFEGKKIILYFYPKNNTPGCTKQACNLRDNYKRLKELGFEIIGISSDSAFSHQKFIKKQNLPFLLITDSDGSISKLYGVWRRFWFNKRRTFIINEKGYIEYIIKNVNTKSHAEQILKILKKPKV